MEFGLAFVMAVVVSIVSSCNTRSRVLEDCATRGETKSMYSDTVIECKVKPAK